MTAEQAPPATFEEYAAARGAALLRFAHAAHRRPVPRGGSGAGRAGQGLPAVGPPGRRSGYSGPGPEMVSMSSGRSRRVVDVYLGGQPARWSRSSPSHNEPRWRNIVPGRRIYADRLDVPTLAGYYVTVEGVGRKDAVRVAESLRLGGEPMKPETWPR